MKKIIIIGAGMGGLVAGNLLARKGYKVTIFESHNTPGGYTAGFWKNGFYFESGTLAFESSDFVFKSMKDIGIYEKIEFIRKNARWVSNDFDDIPESFDEFKNMFYVAYPAEKEKLRRYFSEVDKMCSAMLAIDKPKNLISVITYPLGLLRIWNIYRKYKNLTISEFTNIFFDKDSKLYRSLKNFGYPDMAAWILGGAVIVIFNDYWTVKEGMQSWANALADNLKTLGGELRLSSYVDKIITKNGVAVGVSCEDKIYEANYVIAASDYKKTFLKLLDNKSLIPERLQEKIDSTQVSEGFVTVYLGLKLSNEELKKYMKLPYVFYGDEKSDIDVHNPSDAKFFEKTAISLYSPSMRNHKLAPEGKSSLMIQAIVPNNWMQNWGGGDKQEYKKLKDGVKNALIEKTCNIIPDLKNVIEFEDAATPLTYERYTHNTNGATSSWSWNPKNKFYKNFMSVNVDTPVKNLYIGSCWATQIGGVPSAIRAAYQCVKK